MASEGRSRRRRSRRREAQAQRTPRIQHCQPSVAQTTIRQPQRGYSRSLNRFATAGEPVRTCDQADASGNPAHLERLTHFRRQPSTVELHVPRHLGVPCTELPRSCCSCVARTAPASFAHRCSSTVDLFRNCAYSWRHFGRQKVLPHRGVDRAPRLITGDLSIVDWSSMPDFWPL